MLRARMSERVALPFRLLWGNESGNETKRVIMRG